jgi:molecular chaperone GrpE
MSKESRQSPGASRKEEEPVTARDEAAEPAGEENPANEVERDPNQEPGDRRLATGDSDAESTEPDEPEDPLAKAERERNEYLALAQRTQADFENWRKRAAKEAAAAGQRAKGGIVRELLPVVDNLERALESAQESEQHLAEGVRLVHAELVAVLERNGVESFDPAGESFDPELHEALSTRTEDGSDPGLVLDVVEKGYKLNGTVLRPARVVVSG